MTIDKPKQHQSRQTSPLLIIKTTRPRASVCTSAHRVEGKVRLAFSWMLIHRSRAGRELCADPPRRLRSRDRGFRRAHPQPGRPGRRRGVRVPRRQRSAGFGVEDVASGPARCAHRLAQSGAADRTDLPGDRALPAAPQASQRAFAESSAKVSTIYLPLMASLTSSFRSP